MRKLALLALAGLFAATVLPGIMAAGTAAIAAFTGAVNLNVAAATTLGFGFCSLMNLSVG